MASPTPVNPQWVRPPRRRSIFGPIVLITIGIMFLLVNTGRISARNLFILFSEYWPVLLIIWGGIKLLEYAQAKREGYPPPGIGAGGVVLLIFVILFGTAISAARRGMNEVNWGKVRDEININDEDLGDLFGQKYEFTENLDHAFPANGNLKAVVERGDLKISPSTDDKVHIAVRKSLYAGSQEEAKKISDNTNLSITVVENLLNVDASQHGDWKGGSINLEIFVPKKAALDLMTLRGAVSVNDRDGQVKINNSHGDVSLNAVNGNADVHLRGGDFNAQNVKGDINLEGRVSSANVSAITGKLSLQGDFDEIQLSKLDKGVHFNSSRTDMDIPKLDGNLTMSRGDFRADNVTGPVRLVTKYKDINMDGVSGDIQLQNSNGSVELQPKAPIGSIDVKNQKGEVNLVMPANANFTVDAAAMRGEIESDFDFKVENSNHEARANGPVNKGGPRVQIRNDHGTINIRKQ
jgi:DUF4097 and DUF4098 domain-containing protein YvlB